MFDSVLGEDFREDSDVDVLVAFEPDIPWSLYDWIDMIVELKEIFGRKVDLVEKSGLRNPLRKKNILNSRKMIFACD